MFRVLLLDGDEVCLTAMQLVLERAGYEVACSQDALSGLPLIGQFKPDVVLIDLRLPDVSGLEVLRLLRRQATSPRCILVTRFGHDQARAEAIRLGAFDCVEQPLTPGLLLALVHNAASGRTDQERDRAGESHALARWADVVVRGVRSPKDMPTLQEWGRSVAVSKGGIRNWCYTASLSPRQSLQFMRVLRAVINQTSLLGPEDLLDIVDRRTLAKLLMRSGGTTSTLPKDVVLFLDRQRIIQNVKALAAVRAALCLDGDRRVLGEPRRHENGESGPGTKPTYWGPDRRNCERRRSAQGATSQAESQRRAPGAS